MLDMDKNAQNWLEQGAWNIFWRFSIPRNELCLEWSRLQNVYPIPSDQIPVPVT